MFTNILLTLFVIALAFTVAGFLLSYRSHLAANKPQSASRRSADTQANGSYHRGSRVYSSNTLANEATMIKSMPKYVKASPRLKAPAANVRYEVYREETFVSRALPHFNIMQFVNQREGQPTPWAGAILILIVLFIFSMDLALPILHRSSVGAFFIPSLSAPNAAPAVKTAVKTSTQPSFANVKGVSASLTRLNQLDRAQYNSDSEYNTWAASTCSAAAMTEVINAYTHKNYRVTDILKVETQVHEISPDAGLLQNQGIGITVAKFGFASNYLNSPTLDTVEQIGNQGHPVIVNFPPDRWPGGHLLVVRGGDSNNVYLADSSELNMQVMARATFMKYWGGFGVVVFPK
jgi:hypothetical protein